MIRYFVDAGHLIALANPNDQWHDAAVRNAKLVADQDSITTEDVLIEFLNFYSEAGPYMRRKVVDIVRSILTDVRYEIVSRDEVSFHDGLDLYEARLDKGYSLTDCISMNICRMRGISEVLSNDDHFRQEGFAVLLSEA